MIENGLTIAVAEYLHPAHRGCVHVARVSVIGAGMENDPTLGIAQPYLEPHVLLNEHAGGQVVPRTEVLYGDVDV